MGGASLQRATLDRDAAWWTLRRSRRAPAAGDGHRRLLRESVTQESVDRPEPVQLYDVRSLGNRPEQVIEAFIADQQSVLRGLPVEHIGATAMPFGHTKADVDVNLRVDAS